MDDSTFEVRLAESGLKPSREDLAALRALVADLDRAAAAVRVPRPYYEEPLSAFRLKRG
jgi:hypothetical protein